MWLLGLVWVFGLCRDLGDSGVAPYLPRCSMIRLPGKNTEGTTKGANIGSEELLVVFPYGPFVIIRLVITPKTLL